MGQFAFISYSRRNRPLVLSLVRRMQSDGYHFWMDRSIQGGSRWSEEIACRIRDSACCLLFVSHAYVQSTNCEDEWSYARRKNKTIIKIYLDAVTLPEGMEMQTSRFQSLVYDGTENFWKELYASKGMKDCRYEYNEDETKALGDALHTERPWHSFNFDADIRRLLQWLTGLNPRWGALDSSREAQHANTCEGLLAMKLAGYDAIRKQSYQRIWKQLCQDMTSKGLSSKSLGRETVVCTSMLLLLAALERDKLSDKENAQFDSMACHLWSVRNEDFGWGVYLEVTDREQYSNANTAWALRALREYPEIGKSEDYAVFCQRLFESERDGTFSFYYGEKPKLIVTAMFVGLFYRMDSAWREEQRRHFDLDAALRFIYHSFVEKNTQVEHETLYGIDSSGNGPKKVPWNHITVWAALDALSKAYYNGDLDRERWNRLLQHMERVIEENVCRTGNEVFYQPEGMEESRGGHFTFPTSYLIMGLSQLIQSDEERTEE